MKTITAYETKMGDIIKARFSGSIFVGVVESTEMDGTAVVIHLRDTREPDHVMRRLVLGASQYVTLMA